MIDRRSAANEQRGGGGFECILKPRTHTGETPVPHRF
jgi:hypothetical protein